MGELKIKVVNRSVRKAVNEVKARHYDTVAYKEGDMRDAYSRAFHTIEAPNSFTALFNKQEMFGEAPHSRYQTLAPEGDRIGAAYKEPSEPGTKPLSIRTLHRDMRTTVRRNLNIELSALGVEHMQTS